MYNIVATTGASNTSNTTTQVTRLFCTTYGYSHTRYIHVHSYYISGSGNSDISPITSGSIFPSDTVCVNQFIKVNGTYYPHDVTVILTITRMFAACYGLFIGIVFLILSFVRWKTMYVN